jgi:5-methylcytosine-specific restriction endonuclease McrA
MLRDSTGRFAKGNEGFWIGKKRPSMTGSKNPKWVERIMNVCPCGKTVITTKARNQKTCSRVCRYKAQSLLFTGDRNPRWNGGNSSWKDMVKSSPEYKAWRLRVFQRDRFTCRKCGHRSKKSRAHGDKTSDIHAHHIEPMRDNKSLWFIDINGITLCVSCHRETYGKEEKFAKVFKEILNDYTPDNPKG